MLSMYIKEQFANTGIDYNLRAAADNYTVMRCWPESAYKLQLISHVNTEHCHGEH